MKKELKKENIKDLSYKDIAYLILERSETGINTLELFQEVINKLELSSDIVDTKIADFYTSLTTDKRFLMVDGLWDLRVRHTSDKVLSQVDDEDEEESFEDVEEDLENEEDTFEEMDNLDDAYDDGEDDGLSDLVVLDEDEIEEEN